MSSYKHFTLEDRRSLEKLLSEDRSFAYISEAIGFSVSAISREVKRNRSKYPKKPTNKYGYNAWRAQTLANDRRREKCRRCLTPDTKEWDYIVAGLQAYWSPEQICNRWHKDFPEEKPLHFSTIYHYIARGEFSGIKRKTHLRRRGKRLLPRNSNYNSIQPEHLITERPDVINNRERLGDWEGDTVYGGIGKGLIVTQVDRRTRFLKAALLPRREAVLTKDVIVEMMSGLPVKSITLDNGSEFSEFKEIEKELKTTVYFAEPHKPWQRGTNENTNDLLRFFFPKGFDFRSITQDDLDYVVERINTRPRKCLGWRTPAEVFAENLVALA